MKYRTVDELGISKHSRVDESRIRWQSGNCPECGDRTWMDADGSVWCRSALYMEGPCSPIRLKGGGEA